MFSPVFSQLGGSPMRAGFYNFFAIPPHFSWALRLSVSAFGRRCGPGDQDVGSCAWAVVRDRGLPARTGGPIRLARSPVSVVGEARVSTRGTL